MISSMTAFSRVQDNGDWGSAAWELRSVNSRYLEINVRLPEHLRELEPHIREQISQFLARGKVDVTLKYTASATMAGQLNLNKSMMAQLGQAISGLETELGRAVQLDAARLLSWPGVLEEQSPDMSPIHQAILALLKRALQSMVEMRNREGSAITEMISSRLLAVEERVQTLRVILPELTKMQRDQLLAKLSDLAVDYDKERFEHELVYLAQKADVAEELDRLEAHVLEVRRSLSKEGSMGRRLDFLMQELNREANTLGSKAADSRVTMTAVELKVLIEQMREQVQNIE
jgi:uncharacterized protein (TIGR00255 family)